jgi:superfamily I DNA/RNA helicase
VDYLAKLNADQRRAVEHGTADQAPAPLLVIAGAGTGKTNTLAHRVAHLIANGVDPRRILLLTFSRRAAVEMTRRVQRIVTSVGNQFCRGNCRIELVWDLSRYRGSITSRVRKHNWIRSEFYNSGPRGRG